MTNRVNPYISIMLLVYKKFNQLIRTDTLKKGKFYTCGLIYCSLMKPEVVAKEALAKEYLKETVEKLAKKYDFNMYVNNKGRVIFDEPMPSAPALDAVYKIMKELLKELAETKAKLWFAQDRSQHKI